MSNSINTIVVKPAQGNLIVRDPVTRKPLDIAGESKPRNAFWLRRLRDGDVTEIKKPVTSKTESKPKEGKTS